MLAVASALQTIPGLALLALMVPLLSRIGFVPAVVALTLYSVLPMLRNAVTGITNVDARVIEAGRGLGMTENQLLVRVQLPLALPVIVAGIRTAAVWVVGMATLSTPVGATSLGNYIFSGLQTRNFAAVLVGCGDGALETIVEVPGRPSGLGWRPDGALLISPYYNKPMPEGVYQHYAAVAKAVLCGRLEMDVKYRSAVRATAPTGDPPDQFLVVHMDVRDQNGWFGLLGVVAASII